MDTPHQAKGMAEVTKEEFFRPIYSEKLNVHPSIVGEHHPDHGYLQVWKFQDFARYGLVFGVTWGKRYWVQQQS